MNETDKKNKLSENDIKAINGFADFMNGIWGNNNITKIETSQEYKEIDKYTIHLTDEQYRKVIDAAQKDAKKEIIDKIENKIEELRKIHQERDFYDRESYYLDCYKELRDELCQ